MPWRGPSYDGEFPSIGWLVVEWLENTFTVADGPLVGEPLRLTDEQTSLIVRFYQLDSRGRFVFRRASVRRAQGWGKSPLMAGVALAELCGPSEPDGWNAAGEPVGRPPSTPWVQLAACSEDQTDNSYSAAYAMASESDLAGSVLDVGLTRIFLRDQMGRLEPVTASAGTRLGQRVTFAVLDETHLWTPRNGGVKLAATIRRNTSKMDGRSFESTNAFEPGEDSVAERTYNASQKGAPGLLYDSAEAPEVKDLTDRKAVMAALRVAYGESSAWVDLSRIADEIADPGTDPTDSRRFYFSQIVSDATRPVDVLAWEALAAPTVEVPDGAYIGVGFDGSISEDSTVLYGCTPGGHIFEIAAWERPASAPEDWRVPRVQVHEAVEATFEVYRVGRMLCDPPRWWTEIEAWAARYGEDVVVALDTQSARRFAPACGRFAVSVREGAVSHDGRPGLTVNLAACARKRVRIADQEDDGRSPFVIVKADRRKIDRAVGAILALEAAMTMPPPPAEPSYISMDEVAREMRENDEDMSYPY
jgi:hypothetical protein